jgi:TM2 domain-containing membrane protein YozV
MSIKREIYMTRHIRHLNWLVVLVISIIFGTLGVDRFVMGKVGTGLLKLITCGGLGLWWLVDVILIAGKHKYTDVVWE